MTRPKHFLFYTLGASLLVATGAGVIANYGPDQIRVTPQAAYTPLVYSDILTGSAGSAIVLGQTTGEGEEGEEPAVDRSGSEGGEANTKDKPAAAVPFGEGVTGAISLTLDLGSSACSAVPDAYLVDCLATFYRRAADQTPSVGDYAEIHAALDRAATELEAIVRANRDTSQPNIRVKSASGPDTIKSGPIRAIKPESIAQAKADAFKIVAETETILLRSADSQSVEGLQYARIAEAVGSNKVLLRS